MTTKATLIATASILIGTVLVGLAVLFLFLDPGAPRAKDRAALLGQGLAMLSLIPIGILWITWAVRFRKERVQKLRDQQLRLP